VIEILSGLGVVAYGALAITIGVRYLNIIDHQRMKEEMVEKPIVVAATD
jgi:Ni/Fe-hydrogenase subunit HybB-like protein